MGLDMYLYKKTYVQNWDYMKPEQRHEITVKFAGETRKDIKPERIGYIIEQVAYWRKANQIHKWFVDTCGKGIDECQEIYVCREELQTLLELCQTVIESPDKAADLLPSEGGFFFGSTDYDDSYFTDLKDTVAMLTGILKEHPNETGASFYYQASW